MGRATRGVKGISLGSDEQVVGMVVAEAERTLLTVCELGYGKRTPFGTGITSGDDDENDADATSSSAQYRRQRRGGKGLRDIKTTDRNGRVVDVLSVIDDDEVLMITAKGKIQRLKASDISTIGRNTQGVRVIRLDKGDSLVSCAVIAGDIVEEQMAAAAQASSENAESTEPETTAAVDPPTEAPQADDVDTASE
jgi:DNA gyrase subunit A